MEVYLFTTSKVAFLTAIRPKLIVGFTLGKTSVVTHIFFYFMNMTAYK